MEYSIIIPVFNSEQSLPELKERIMTVFKDISEEFEIIFVDDYSQDNSWNVLFDLKSESPNKIRLFRLGKNFGQHNATICGFHQARGKWIVTMDDDLQQAPEDIPLLIERQKETGANVVYGISNENHPLLRKVGSNVYKKSTKHLHGSFGNGSSFRLIDASLINKLKGHKQQFNFIDEILHWHTNFIECVRVSHAPRKYGKSTYSAHKLWMLANNNTLNYSNLPLKLMMYFGGVFSFIFIIIGMYFIAKKMVFGVSVPGFTALIVSVSFSASLMLLCFGILGYYLKNILSRLNNQPAYFIKEEL
ncbi:glycosyltransferase [Aequorivita sp. H23M31]|uniref:Glycosyltransferase n=1 Tax=Aequorivita ciconiae TaxID=2494375 RepID=A0A410G4D3_9FLAO|nr:glycosyltransferase family 2 protein [Aequorivita sp. H23M31]QAA82130.1 glycosyltransferase [Aequorivita sp. H23M31]